MGDSTPPIPLGSPAVFGSGALTYSWLPPPAAAAPVTNYNLMVIPDSGIPFNFTLPSNIQSYTVTGLTTYMSYNAYIQASSDGGSTWSPPALYPPAYAFSAPEGYIDAAWAWRNTPTTIQVMWRDGPFKNEGVRPHYYVAGRSKNPADPRVGYATPTFYDSSCVITNLNPSSVYIFSVCFVNEAGRSAKARTNNVYPLDD